MRIHFQKYDSQDFSDDFYFPRKELTPFKGNEPVHFLRGEGTTHSQRFRAIKKTETRLKLSTAHPAYQFCESISAPDTHGRVIKQDPASIVRDDGFSLALRESDNNASFEMCARF